MFCLHYKEQLWIRGVTLASTASIIDWNQVLITQPGVSRQSPAIAFYVCDPFITTIKLNVYPSLPLQPITSNETLAQLAAPWSLLKITKTKKSFFWGPAAQKLTCFPPMDSNIFSSWTRSCWMLFKRMHGCQGRDRRISVKNRRILIPRGQWWKEVCSDVKHISI